MKRGRRSAKIIVTTVGKPPLSAAAAFARLLAARLSAANPTKPPQGPTVRTDEK